MLLLVYKVYIYYIKYKYIYTYISIADFHMMLSLCYPYDCCWWFDWFRSGEMLINGLLCAVEIRISIGWISLCPIPVPWISTFRNMCSSRFFREQFFCKPKNIWAKEHLAFHSTACLVSTLFRTGASRHSNPGTLVCLPGVTWFKVGFFIF